MESKDDREEAKGSKEEAAAKESHRSERKGGYLLEDVAEFYATSPRLDAALQAFVAESARGRRVERGAEYALELTDLHGEYKALIDRQLAAFLSRRGCSTADFLDVADADPLGAETLGEMVTAAASFETFVDLLVDAQEGRWAGAGCVTYA